MASEDLSVEEIIDSSQKAFYAFDMEQAEKLLNEGLKKYPNDFKLLGAYGEFCSETGDGFKAIECFKKSIELMPNGDSFRYFSLGQLQSGYEALNNYKTGISVLRKEIANTHTCTHTHKYQKHQLSRVYCAIAEIFMTDLCDEENAEGEVVSNINSALENDSNFLEAHHVSAIYFKVVGDIDKANKEIKICLKQLIQKPPNNEPDISLELRINISRTLIDLNMSAQAICLLEGCLQEDETDIQVWYVLACANYTLQNYETAKECAEMAYKLLKGSPLWGDENCEMNVEITKLISHIDEAIITDKKTLKQKKKRRKVVKA